MPMHVDVSAAHPAHPVTHTDPVANCENTTRQKYNKKRTLQMAVFCIPLYLQGKLECERHTRSPTQLPESHLMYVAQKDICPINPNERPSSTSYTFQDTMRQRKTRTKLRTEHPIPLLPLLPATPFSHVPPVLYVIISRQ